MKLIFKATKYLNQYAGTSGIFKDRDEKEVTDEQAKYLLSDYPDNFFTAEEVEKKGKIAGMKVPKKDGDK